MSTSIQVQTEGEIRAMRELQSVRLTPDRMRLLLRAIGTEVKKMAQANVTKQIASPKAYQEELPGAKTTRTLERLRASINFILQGSNAVRIFANDIIAAQRQYGGPIEAKNAGALTLPVNPLAYGHRAGEFANLIKLVIGPKHTAVLAAIGGKAFDAGTRAGQRGLENLRSGKADASRFTIMFLLLKRVVTKPHPYWPTIDQAVARAVDVFLNFIRNPPGGAAHA